jgi:hypothetical protein
MSFLAMQRAGAVPMVISDQSMVEIMLVQDRHRAVGNVQQLKQSALTVASI